LMIFGFWLTLV